MKLRKKYHNELVQLRGNIRVFCRVRPRIREDGDEEGDLVVTPDIDDDSLLKVNNTKGRDQQYDLDKVFGLSSTQAQIFEEVSSLVRSAIDGYNVCIFAYGQTGSGKTYTMEGVSDDPGINQRALQLLFEETSDASWTYDISAGVMEIYNESIRDLLNPDPANKL
ncbi:kinesin-like protein KIFC3, partial [Aplysia californica]